MAAMSDISLTGTIATNGKDAYGILAQSVGGSGGIVFAPTTAADKSNPEAMFGGGTLYGTGADVSVGGKQRCQDHHAGRRRGRYPGPVDRPAAAA